MSKGFSLFFLFGIYFSAGAQNAFVNSTVAKNPRHIVRIAGDSLVVTNGTTYEFTVDTPEDQGLRSTKPSVGELLSEFIAMNGSRSGYKITDKDGLLKNGGELESSDRLVVLSKDGTVKKQYFIALKPFAVNGCLELEQAQMTANVPSHFVLFFTAGQRTPDATVKIYLPKEINITMDNTTVNLIGRGDVKLKDL
ncbi:MAG: endopygalactorunase, partial [Flavisolibacter sp.]